MIAYHKFLKQKSYYPRDCKLIQYLTVPKVFVEEFSAETKVAIEEIKNKIVEDFGDKVIEIIEMAPDDIERYLIWAETDILFITNKRDGLYMSPLEYVVVRNAIGKDKKSTVLMSEFVGGSRLLNGAFRFNPYNIREMVKCLEHAVDLCPPLERERKFKSMLDYVNSHPVDKWAYKFLKDIKFINQKRKAMLGIQARQLLNNKLAMEKKKEYASSKDFIRSFKLANSRLIIILLKRVKELLIDKNSEDEDEYETEEISDNEISDMTIELIKRLSKEPNTKVWVITADSKNQLHDTFANVEDLGLAAEDGYFYRWNSKGGKNKLDWSRLIKDDDCSWIELVRSVMQVFSESTEGSYIQEKESMIAWNFSRVAPDYGLGQMKELHSLLKDVIRNFDIEINAYKGFLEVKSKAEPKALITKIMQKLSLVAPIDFVFAFGDDERYNDIFSFLENKKNYSRYCAPKCTSVAFSNKNAQFIQSVLMKLIEGG